MRKNFISTITGNGSGRLIIAPTRGKRVGRVQAQISYAGGTNTVAGFAATITEVRVKADGKDRWKLNGVKLRDFLLFHGTQFDWNGLPNVSAPNLGVQLTIPLAPEWFMPAVQDKLAWNPKLLGEITIEIDSSATLTCSKCIEYTDDNLNAGSFGIITLDQISAVCGGVETVVETPIKERGSLLSLHVYAEDGTGDANEPSTALLTIGKDKTIWHDKITQEQNDEDLDRHLFPLAPTASGRTAKIYDLVQVHGDLLERAVPLVRPILTVTQTAGSGSHAILLVRLEPNVV